MLRRNFITNLAITLPVGMMAPDVLLGKEDKKITRSPQGIIAIDAGQLDEEMLAALKKKNIPVLLLSSAAVRQITCVNRGFEVSDYNNNVFLTQKLITGTSAKLKPYTSSASIAIPGSIDFTFKYSGKQHAARPVIVTTPEKRLDMALLTQFAGKNNAAVMLLF